MNLISMIVSVLLGALPFAAGEALNDWMMANPDQLPPMLLIEFLSLLVWGLLAFFLRWWMGSTKRVLLGLHGIACVVLVLLGVQELILHTYWMNPLGIWTQFYFLTLLNLSYRLTAWSSSMVTTYCAAFGCMVGAAVVWRGRSGTAYQNKMQISDERAAAYDWAAAL